MTKKRTLFVICPKCKHGWNYHGTFMTPCCPKCKKKFWIPGIWKDLNYTMFEDVKNE